MWCCGHIEDVTGCLTRKIATLIMNFSVSKWVNVNYKVPIYPKLSGKLIHKAWYHEVFRIDKIFRFFWKNYFSFFQNYGNSKSKKVDKFLLLAIFSNILILNKYLINFQCWQMRKHDKICQKFDFKIPKFIYIVKWYVTYPDKLIWNWTYFYPNQFSIW